MDDRARYFEQSLWPHFRAAYNIARWLVGNHQDAEDVVQESFVKAFQSADSIRGADARPWLLAIVRNSALNVLRGKVKREVPFKEGAPEPADKTPSVESALLERKRREEVRAAMQELPVEFREVMLLREMEGMPYKEIAAVLKVPIGTVMSRLSRARSILIERLSISKENPR